MVKEIIDNGVADIKRIITKAGWYPSFLVTVDHGNIQGQMIFHFWEDYLIIESEYHTGNITTKTVLEVNGVEIELNVKVELPSLKQKFVKPSCYPAYQRPFGLFKRLADCDGHKRNDSVRMIMKR